MKIVAPKEKLANAFLLAENIVAAKSTMSILSNILLETADNKLKVIATDLDVAIKIFVNVSVEKEGGITLHAKTLTNVVKSLSNDDIILIVDESSNITTIKSVNEEVKVEFNLKGLPKTDFPVFPTPKVEKEYEFTLPQKILKDMIRKTIYAVSKEDIASSYNGVELEIKNKYLKFAATDAMRLSTIKVKLDTDVELDNIIIPRKVLSELLKILSDEGEVKIGISENFVYFKLNEIELASRLIEGQFPDYVNIIPKDYEKKVVFFTNKMLNAIKRVSIISSMDKAIIRFIFSKNKVEVVSLESEIGKAKEEIEINYDYEDFEIRFSSEFLLDAINSIDTDQFIMGFNSPHSAAMIKEEGNDDFLGLIMPIRIE